MAEVFEKPGRGIEAIQPEMIKYLKEASEIVYGDGGSSAFLAGSECMTMPVQ